MSTKAIKIAADPSPAMTNLQNQWYNTLSTAVGGNGNFQIIQPNNGISGSMTDDQVWQYFNSLPPASLNNNLTLSGGNQFYSNYAGVIGALVSTASTAFQNIVGSYFPLWQQYLRSLTTFPTPQAMPGVFYQWASLNATASIAGAGQSALQAQLSDPILLAATMDLNTAGFKNNTPNFSEGITQLLQQLPTGSAVTVPFDTSTASSNVTNTWCQGSGGAFWGLFGGDSSASQLTQQFASSRVSGSVSFGSLITFVAEPPGAPGGWYSSAALGAAYAASSGGAPWAASGSAATWASTFGPNGNMQRFLTGLVVAAGVTVKLTSGAQYSASQQTQAQQSCSVGCWPFYGSESSGFSNQVSFNADSTMNLTITTPASQPVIIGGFVLPAGKYLGGS